ncbi:hypothetical protein V2J09_017729 [Rumex salicifolius]
MFRSNPNSGRAGYHGKNIGTTQTTKGQLAKPLRVRVWSHPFNQQYLPGEFVVAAVAEEFWNRDEVLRQLKWNLDQDQKRMVSYANRMRREKVGVVAYELKLPTNAKVLLLFHVSFPKKLVGGHKAVVELPTDLILDEEEFILEAILEVKKEFSPNRAYHKVLVQLNKKSKEEAS